MDIRGTRILRGTRVLDHLSVLSVLRPRDIVSLVAGDFPTPTLARNSVKKSDRRGARAGSS